MNSSFLPMPGRDPSVNPKSTMGVPSVRRKVVIPLRGGAGTFYTFRGLNDAGEHLAIGLGQGGAVTPAIPLVRIHSECLTGDLFGSAKCDCGEQLEEAMGILRRENGVLLYLRQEGRGIGLYNKLDAYQLQAQGMDTYEANAALGFADDLRDFRVAAQMLGALGIGAIRLLTNNPDKARQIEEAGIRVVEAISTGVYLKQENARYLQAKVRKTGHRIHLDVAPAARFSVPVPT